MGYSARKWTYRLAEIYFSQEDADTFNKMNQSFAAAVLL
jgi:hypothetical protein